MNNSDTLIVKHMPAICIFAYKRPAHLKRVLDELAANPPAAGLPLIVRRFIPLAPLAIQ